MVVPEKKSPEDHYELFKRYAEFVVPTPNIDRKKLFRYIPLAYDKNSPLHAVLTDIKKIKGKAAELAGFKKSEGGRYTDAVEHMIACFNTTVNYMIIRYITLHKNKLYHRFIVFNEMYDNMSATLLQTPGTKAEIQAFTELGDTIDVITQELLSADTELENDFLEYYIENDLRLRPEDIAEKRAKGEDITSA
jgi:hypothetical protein